MVENNDKVDSFDKTDKTDKTKLKKMLVSDITAVLKNARKMGGCTIDFRGVKVEQLRLILSALIAYDCSK